MTERANVFLELAAQQISAPVKARQRAAEKHTARQAAVDKRLDERDAQARAWRAWRRERRQHYSMVSTGPAAADLLQFLKSMTLDDGAALIAFVDRGRGGDSIQMRGSRSSPWSTNQSCSCARSTGCRRSTTRSRSAMSR